jgi:hypothetical protein
MEAFVPRSGSKSPYHSVINGKQRGVDGGLRQAVVAAATRNSPLFATEGQGQVVLQIAETLRPTGMGRSGVEVLCKCLAREGAGKPKFNRH